MEGKNILVTFSSYVEICSIVLSVRVSLSAHLDSRMRAPPARRTVTSVMTLVTTVWEGRDPLALQGLSHPRMAVSARGACLEMNVIN
jgi:hypothetical protein